MDFPEPVLPVTKIIPALCLLILVIISGMDRSSNDAVFIGIERKIPPTPFKCLNAFTRNRPVPSRLCAKSALSSFSKAFRERVGIIFNNGSSNSFALNLSSDIVSKSPYTRIRGGSPDTRCRSEPPRATNISNSVSISTIILIYIF